MPRSLGRTTAILLAALDHGLRYGLDVIQHTELPAGTVYTSLRRLERRGLVEGRWEDAEIAEAERRPRRRYYELTDRGRAALSEVEPLHGSARELLGSGVVDAHLAEPSR